MGGNETFRNFLTSYISTYSLQNINYEDLRFEFETWVNSTLHNNSEVINAVNWTEWVMVPGPIPDYALSIVNFTNSDEIEARQLADAYIDLKGESSPDNYMDYYKFYANQKVIFILQFVNRYADFDESLMAKVDSDL